MNNNKNDYELMMFVEVILHIYVKFQLRKLDFKDEYLDKKIFR